ncbi:hypothetical protein G7Y89_g10145 [Cudoniella acicularis]|uniref:Rhodopsin domain-containing protein n=1 Tax=Cudoniella acicularis TaxID=354080 RepID=A0A8H4RDB4_9HELO|nr:hypothetical protein G7Y89_g10145 [Cudoniella acicularis]
MGDFDPAFVHALAVQSWSLYSVGMSLILLRMYARISRLGFKGLQLDDYLMMLAGGLYTALIVCLNVISGGGGSNLYLPEDFPTFTPEDIQERIKGSKIVLISEQACSFRFPTTPSRFASCVLLIYTRLTLGLAIQRMVFYLAIYVAVGWVATEIAFFTACSPFPGYWAMPPPDPQCTTLQHYAIIQACFNISSDSLMLMIPLPLITRLAVPWKQKAILMVIFSMGIFVILAAILTKVFNLANIWDPSYMLWYTREASVAVYVSNLPLIWPLLKDWFPALRKLTPGGGKSSSGHEKHGYGLSSRPRTTTIAGRHLSGHFGGKRLSEGDSSNPKTGVTTVIRGKGESSEDISTTEIDMDDVEMGGTVTRTDSWDNLRATPDDNRMHIIHNQTERWDGVGMIPVNAIHMSTTVQIREEHIEAPMQVPSSLPRREHNSSPAPPPASLVQSGTFQWDFTAGNRQ